MISAMMIMVLMILPREHNRVAAELAKMHPAWNDDKIYSEVREAVKNYLADFFR